MLALPEALKLHGFDITRILYGINRVINGITLLIKSITRVITGLTQLINGWGAPKGRRGKGGAGG